MGSLAQREQLHESISNDSVVASARIFSQSSAVHEISEHTLEQWNRSTGPTKRKAMIKVNLQMYEFLDRFQPTEEFPDSIQTEVIEDDNIPYPYTEMVITDTYGGVLRKSMPLNVFLIPGMTILEHLVKSVDEMLLQGRNVKENDVEITWNTMKGLEAELGLVISKYDNKERGQILFVLEKLFVDGTPSHGKWIIYFVSSLSILL